MGRPAKSDEEKLVEVPCKVSPDVADKIAAIAAATDRYRGQITRKLVYRGLAAYNRDGQLDEPAKEGNGKIEHRLPNELARWFNSLPAKDQETILTIVEALHKKHAAESPLRLAPGRTIATSYIPSDKKGGRK